MRIAVRGWGRDLGETELMDVAIDDFKEVGDGRLDRDTLYKRIDHLDNKHRTKVRFSRSIEARLGGTYLMRVELTRREIAQLFFETRSGAMVRMIKSFLDDEEEADRAAELQRFAAARESRARFLRSEARG